MGSLSRKLHKKTGGEKRTVYVDGRDLGYYQQETRRFLEEMRKTHHRDEFARVSVAFVSAVGRKYGLPEGWYE